MGEFSRGRVRGWTPMSNNKTFSVHNSVERAQKKTWERTKRSRWKQIKAAFGNGTRIDSDGQHNRSDIQSQIIDYSVHTDNQIAATT